jgi:tetratricopeptide (TPR) repeat protein
MSRLEQLQGLLAKEPQDVFLNFGLAMELAKSGRYEESDAQFERVIGLDPGYIPAYFQKGRARLAAGDVEGAKADLARGMERAAACGDLHARGEMEELLRSL